MISITLQKLCYICIFIVHNMKQTSAVILSLLLLTMCQRPEPKSDRMTEFDIEGHRGCRGLMPENTLPAFQKALELGVTTLELDLVISQDKKVVVSHEPYFRSGLALTPDGKPITKEEEKEHNLYALNYDQIKLYDVGSLPDEKYPEKENIKTFKPLLADVVHKANDYSFITNTPMPDFNIEIKRVPEQDGVFHPGAEEFASLVLHQVKELNIFDKTIIQSFDPESLRIVKAKEPRIRVALLIANQKTVEENIQNLGYAPDIYSCYYQLLTSEDIAYCHERDIKVIPWTVNEVEDMTKMIELGVDGIITDYPDRLIAIVR